MDTEDKDREFIAGIRRGDEAALDALVEKYLGHLCQYAFLLLGRRDLAQEAVADVFISMWQRRDSLSIGTTVHTYLFKSTSNNAINLRRTDVHPDEVPIDEVAPIKLLDETGDSEMYRDLLDEIEELLETMPLERRQVFRMNCIQNLRHKEIAATLGITVNVVQKHLDIAKRQIADGLSKRRCKPDAEDS